MVVFFSGTGNSEHIARLVAEKTGDELVSANELIKSHWRGELDSAGRSFVFVCPAYAWRIPRVFEEFIRGAVLSGCRGAYFIVTCGLYASKAVRYVERLCAQKGLDLLGYAEIIMPENYIVMYPAPSETEAEKIVREAEAEVIELSAAIAECKSFPPFKPRGMFRSSLWNAIFYRFIIKDDSFRTTDKCTGCGKCVKLCPLNNIELRHGKPSWKGGCTHCMACICLCPTEAVEYGSKTVGRVRYHMKPL